MLIPPEYGAKRFQFLKGTRRTSAFFLRFFFLAITFGEVTDDSWVWLVEGRMMPQFGVDTFYDSSTISITFAILHEKRRSFKRCLHGRSTIKTPTSTRG